MTSRYPRARYADADGVRIAYEVRGDGPIDLVRVTGAQGSLAAGYADPALGRFLDRLAVFSRVIGFDRRGLGLSDPLVAGDTPPLEQQVADVVAVMDAVGSRRAAVWAGGDGGWVGILFAAMHPDRVTALVLSTAAARRFRAPDYPIGPDPADRERLVQRVKDRWGNLEHPYMIEWLAPSRLNEPGFRELFAQIQQMNASPAAAAASLYPEDLDVRDVLPLVQAPTLVTYAADAPREDQRLHSEYLAQHVPNARLTPYTGAVHADTSALSGPGHLALVEEFITGTRPEPSSDRVLATVMFTDIVVSTEHVTRLGDHEWRQQLDRHDAMVRDQLEAFRGREVSTAGDSFFATFDGPARAIACAQAIIKGASELGIDVRAGVHTGECEVRGDDFAGIAVHVGARVAALGGAGEIYTTSTVRDLVAGSGIAFADVGLRELKGIPEPRHICQVL